MRITTLLATAAAAGALATAAPSPATAAAPCQGVTASAAKVHNMVAGVPATHRLRMLGVECNPQDTLQRLRISYSDPPGGLAFCKAIDSITWNIGAVGGFNPPPIKMPCDIHGKSIEVPFPDSTFKPGNTDRCAGAHVKIVVGGLQPDQEFDVPKVCFSA